MTDPETDGMIRFQLSRLEPKPGDVLVLQYPEEQPVSSDQGRAIGEVVAGYLPEGVDIITIPAGYRLELYQTYKLVKGRQVTIERENQTVQRRPQPNGEHANGKAQ